MDEWRDRGVRVRESARVVTMRFVDLSRNDGILLLPASLEPDSAWKPHGLHCDRSVFWVGGKLWP